MKPGLLHTPQAIAMIMAFSLLAGCSSSNSSTNPVAGGGGEDSGSIQGYPVVGTGQALTYDNTSVIPAPAVGQAFYGQDAQISGHQPQYTLSADSLTVFDGTTGLTWTSGPDTDFDGIVESPDDKLTWQEAQAFPSTLNERKYGGFDDWRLPTIKELYSLILYTGEDVSPEAPEGGKPFLDTGVFSFVYGNTQAGERVIDSQYASSTLYVGDSVEGQLLFGVNFADGRIKGYGLFMPGMGDKTFFLQCVRGNTDYGINDFRDNGDGTVTDAATGLMWTQDDSGAGMDWQDALAWVQARNEENYLGHSDWHLPDVKELQSIVDYTRSPDSSAGAAIDPVFNTTDLINERGEADWGFYWSGTTHASSLGGEAACYVAFGRSLGYMNGSWVDVHGAGAQRSDPKSGDPTAYPTGRGPQGDAIRILNFVRMVRDAG